MKPSLATSGSQSGTYQCVRSLGMRDISVIGVANGSVPHSSRNTAKSSSPFPRRSTTGQPTGTPCSTSSPSALSRRSSLWGDRCLPALETSREGRRTRLAGVPSLDSLETAHDRLLLAEAAAEAGVARPENATALRDRRLVRGPSSNPGTTSRRTTTSTRTRRRRWT